MFSRIIGLLLILSSVVDGAAPRTLDWSWNTQSCNFLMQFGARFRIPYTDTTGAKLIKEQDLIEATVSNSRCTDTDVVVDLRYFLGSSDPDTYHWGYTLEFTKINDVHYELEKITVRYVLSPSRFNNPQDAGQVMTQSTGSVRPKADLGTYLGTDEVSFKMGADEVEVLMTDVKLQPFVGSVQGGGYGTKTDFTYDPNSSNVVTSFGLLFMTVFAILNLVIFQR